MCSSFIARVCTGLTPCLVSQFNEEKLASRDDIKAIAREDLLSTIREIFDAIDADKNGSIDAMELIKAMKSLGQVTASWYDLAVSSR